MVLDDFLCGSDRNLGQLQISVVHRSSENHFLRADLLVEKCCIYTHYYNSNLIWRTVSRRVDEVIPSDPMAWPHPRDVILYAISSYYCDNMFIICLFLTFFLILKPVWTLIPKNCGNVCHNITLRFLKSHHHVFRLWFHA